MAPKKAPAAAATVNRKTQKICDFVITWILPFVLVSLSLVALLSKTIGRTNRKHPPTFAFSYWFDDHISSVIPLVFPLLAWGAASSRFPSVRRGILVLLCALIAVTGLALLPSFHVAGLAALALSAAVAWVIFSYNSVFSAPAPVPLPSSPATSAARALLAFDGLCLLLLTGARLALPLLSPAVAPLLPPQPQVAIAAVAAGAIGLVLLGAAGVVKDLGLLKTMMWIGFTGSLGCSDILSSSTLPAFTPTVLAWTARALAAAHVYVYAQAPLSTAAAVWLRRQRGMLQKLGGLETMGVE